MNKDDLQKVVIQLSTDEVEVHKAVIAQISNLVRAIPSIRIELVVHSRAICFVQKQSHWKDQISGIINNHISVLVCRNTMDVHELRESDLLPSVEIIPSAVAHLVIRQSEGWSYLKAGF